MVQSTRLDEVEYVCPKHGDDGILDVVYDYELIAQRISPDKLAGDPDRSIWRYLPLLPVEPEWRGSWSQGTVLASVGWTPLYPAPRLAAELGLRHLWVKDDGRQPTASFKDRASAIAVVKTRELGYEVVTTASTGNAAAALSGLCAAVAQPNVIFVPRTAPQAKIAQLLVYGATVLLVDGTYDDAFELCLEAAPEFGWYNRNTGYNPYMSEGKKTVAYEICEQLGSGIGRWAPGRGVCARGRWLHHRRRAQGIQGPAGPGLDRPDAQARWASRRRAPRPWWMPGSAGWRAGRWSRWRPTLWPTASSPACPATASRRCAPCARADGAYLRVSDERDPGRHPGPGPGLRRLCRARRRGRLCRAGQGGRGRDWSTPTSGSSSWPPARASRTSPRPSSRWASPLIVAPDLEDVRQAMALSRLTTTARWSDRMSNLKGEE